MLISIIAVLVLGMGAAYYQKVRTSAPKKTQTAQVAKKAEKKPVFKKKHKSDEVPVNKQAMKAAEQSSSSQSSDNNKSNDADGQDSKYGSLGYFSVPSEFKGTWYGGDYNDSKISKVVFGENTLVNGNQTFQLFRQAQDYAKKDHSQDNDAQDHTSKWLAASSNPGSNSDPEISTSPWIQQVRMPGDFWRIHKENGMPILLWSHGADNYVTAVYYPSMQLARQYSKKKFKDLQYM